MIKRAADLFCGAGGMTTGMRRAAKRSGLPMEMVAVNHNPTAITTHQANHPEVRHLCMELDAVDPRKVLKGERLNYLAASPECTHHSIARGGKPCSDQSRASAWHVVRWAEALGPDHIVIENVKEFRDWGPLGRNGRPMKSRKGQTFQALLQALDSLGYQVDHQILNAADYGDATTRNRLFIQAWRRCKPSWPTPTAADRWRPASEVIDWSLRGTSIFGRVKPLSWNTLRRIFAGLEKFCGLSFVMHCTHHGGKRVRSVKEPLPTITCAQRGELALCQPWLINMRGTSATQIVSSAQSTDEPLKTFTAGGGHLGLCEPFILPQNGTARSRSTGEPLPTVVCDGAPALVQAFLLGQQSGATARPVSEPMPTIATAGAISLFQPFLTKFYGTGGAHSVTEPLDTITTRDRFGLCLPEVVVKGERYFLDILFRMLQPHELSAAMGFDSDYYFAGNKSEQVNQIGNAVAVGTSEALFYNIMSGGRS